jgi:uracil-DNA glycosylase family 4
LNPFVPTSFPLGPSNGIAVVGEAPGFYEATYKRPFVGPSGQLLDKVLAHAGVARRETLLTNACLCRPEDNATPPATAVAACRPRLIAELVDANVGKVLALGNVAAKTVLNTTQGILALRTGPPRPSSFDEEVKVVPTVHPAYCLRNGDAFPYIVRDTLKLKFNPPEWEPPTFIVLDTVEEALQGIAQLHTLTDTLVIDIECGIEKDISMSHPNEYDMLCIGIGYAKGKVAVIGENACVPEVYAALRNLFLAKRLVAHNGKFDLSGLFPHLGALTLWFDTMLANYCIDERPGNHRLEQLGPELLGTPDWKNFAKQYLGEGKNYAAIPRPVLYKYNAYDVAVTWDLMEYFIGELDMRKQPAFVTTGATLRGLHDFLIEASNQLMFPELNGIVVDKQYSYELSLEYLALIVDEYNALQKVVTKDYDKKGGINPASPLQVKKYLADQKISVESTKRATLEAILIRISGTSPAAVFIGHLLEHRYLAKRRGTFIEGIRKRTHKGRVFTNYLLHGTTSGRLASRNPNLQNIVRDTRIRGQFTVSHVDNILMQGDYKQVEGRVIATEARDDYLRSIFIDPHRDLFDELGYGLYGKSKLHKEERIRVKAYFYGISYGRTAYSVAKEYKLPLSETEEGLIKFRNLIPSVVEWQEATTQKVLSGKGLITTFGRHRRFGLITKQNRQDVINEGLSFIPQSTASDICLRAFVRLRPRLRGKAFIRLTIHDALVVECKKEDMLEVQEIMREEMVRSAEEWTDYVPFEVDFSTGTNWGQL